MRIHLKMAALQKYGSGRQYLLARDVGMTESRLSAIVVGRTDPTDEDKTAIADALGMSPDELFAMAELFATVRD